MIVFAKKNANEHPFKIGLGIKGSSAAAADAAATFSFFFYFGRKKNIYIQIHTILTGRPGLRYP